MTSDRHDHSRPDRGAQKAALHLAKAILADDRAAIRRASIAGGCPACNAVAAMSFGMALASVFARQPLGSGALSRSFLAAVEAAEAELRGAPN